MFKAPILLAAVALMAACASHADPPQQEEPPYVPGELIVAFEDSSPAREAVSMAMGGALESDPKLTEYIAELSERLGLPCRAAQLTSGGEILLRLDQSALVSTVAEAARRAEGVEAAEGRERPAAARLAPSHEVGVRFATGSALAGALQGAAPDQELPPAIRDWISGLGEELGLELEGRAGENELALAVDLRWATEELMARLREQPEVEYVEVNQLLQIQ